jgi:hypothetical protein
VSDSVRSFPPLDQEPGRPSAKWTSDIRGLSSSLFSHLRAAKTKVEAVFSFCQSSDRWSRWPAFRGLGTRVRSTGHPFDHFRALKRLSLGPTCFANLNSGHRSRFLDQGVTARMVHRARLESRRRTTASGYETFVSHWDLVLGTISFAHLDSTVRYEPFSSRRLLLIDRPRNPES